MRSRAEGKRWWVAGASHLLALGAGFALALVLALPAARLAADPRFEATSDFERALQAVRIRMDAAMCVAPTADPDRDFARTMIPHHQGAVELAQLELLFGRDPRLRRLAQGMVVEQSQEIALMHSVLADRAITPGHDFIP